MGAPAEKRQVGGETWYYYPRQPYGRQTYVARLNAKIVPNSTGAEQVRDLPGSPWESALFPRLDRNIWTWYVFRWGNTALPAQLHVQMSPDGIVREVYIIDEFQRGHQSGLGR